MKKVLLIAVLSVFLWGCAQEEAVKEVEIKKDQIDDFKQKINDKEVKSSPLKFLVNNKKADFFKKQHCKDMDWGECYFIKNDKVFYPYLEYESLDDFKVVIYDTPLNPEKFEILGYGLAKDDNFLQAGYKSMGRFKDFSEEEWSEFNFIDYSLSVSDVPKISYDIEIFNRSYFRAGNSLYNFRSGYEGGYIKELVGADVVTFEVIDGFFAKDKNYVYHHGTEKSDFDVNSFQSFGKAYVKDKNGVYFDVAKTLKLEDVDVDSFVVASDKWGFCAFDKDNIYYWGYKIEDYPKERSQAYEDCKSIKNGK